GTLSRYKGRLVANGSAQLEEVNVDENFSSVVKPGTIQTVLSLAVSRHWPIHQLDVKNAFLHDGTLSHYKERLVTNGSTQLGGLMLMRLSVRLLNRIIRSLHQEFAMTDLGPLNYFIGEHMDNYNPSWTPIDTKSKLRSDGDPVSDPTLYLSLAGSLKYLTFTRSDISYAVQQVCLYMHDPREPYVDSN
nr:ribonuclease H-like domain-containing protein [Tanacetum cinerariifolium]